MSVESLIDLGIGEIGIIAGLKHSNERLVLRMREMGFLEGAEVKVLRYGPFGRDPVAVLCRGGIVALRGEEAKAVLVSKRQVR